MSGLMRAVHTWSGNNYNSSKIEEDDKEEFNFFDNDRVDSPAAATNIVQWLTLIFFHFSK